MSGGVYIGGPMRGQPAFGFQAFFDAEDWLTENTDLDPVFNPARRDEDLGFLAREWELTGDEDLSRPVYWTGGYQFGGYQFDLAAAMEADNAFIRSDECSAIVLLPGWGESTGARDELALADELERQVWFLSHELLSYIPLRADLLAAERHRQADEERRMLAALDEEAPRPLSLTVDFSAVGQEVRVTSPTGGQKGAKPERLGLIPGEALDAIGRVYGFGAEKYADHNWRKGYAWSLSMDALMRHVNAVNKGQWLDDESREPHLAHAAFHINAMLTWAATGQTEQNDIYGLELP